MKAVPIISIVSYLDSQVGIVGKEIGLLTSLNFRKLCERRRRTCRWLWTRSKGVIDPVGTVTRAKAWAKNKGVQIHCEARQSF